MPELSVYWWLCWGVYWWLCWGVYWWLCWGVDEWHDPCFGVLMSVDEWPDPSWCCVWSFDEGHDLCWYCFFVLFLEWDEWPDLCFLFCFLSVDEWRDLCWYFYIFYFECGWMTWPVLVSFCCCCCVDVSCVGVVCSLHWQESEDSTVYQANFTCEGCVRRKTLLKDGKKPTVSPGTTLTLPPFSPSLLHPPPAFPPPLPPPCPCLPPLPPPPPTPVSCFGALRIELSRRVVGVDSPVVVSSQTFDILLRMRRKQRFWCRIVVARIHYTTISFGGREGWGGVVPFVSLFFLQVEV